MKNLDRFLALSLVCCLSSAFVLAEDAKEAKVDPSGTWRWVFDGNGNSIESALTLQADQDGKVTGVLVANDREIKVLAGSIKGNALTVEVKFEMQSREIAGSLQGKISGDKLEGNIQFKSEEGNREFPWKAERSVQASDLVGTWDLSIESPNGEIKSEMVIAKKGDTLTVLAKSQDGQELEAKEVRIEKNQLLYSLGLEVDGADVSIKVKGRPYGSTLTGSMEYSVNGDSGELPFRGVRRK